MECPNCHPAHAIQEFPSTSNTLLIRIAFYKLHRIQLAVSRYYPCHSTGIHSQQCPTGLDKFILWLFWYPIVYNLHVLATMPTGHAYEFIEHSSIKTNRIAWWHDHSWKKHDKHTSITGIVTRTGFNRSPIRTQFRMECKEGVLAI